MVMEKILKVNSKDPKVEELRQKLATLKAQQAPPTAPVAAQAAPAVVSPSSPQTPQNTPVAPKKPTQEEEIARLQQASFEEQKHLLERQQPEIRLREERTLHLLANQIKELINLNNEGNKRIRELEAKHAELEKSLEFSKDKEEEMLQKMNSIDSRLEKFMGLYELITNQYNPFADQTPLRLSPAKPPPKAAGGPVKVEDNLTRSSATVEVSDDDAKEALDRFKHVEALLADLKKQEHSRKQPEPGATPPEPVTSELHALLYGFEQRLRQHLDATLQEKLHGGFTALERSLQSELRDALRRELEALQQDDSHVQQSMTELHELLQASEGKNRGAIEDELGRLSKELEALRDDVKTIPPNLYFKLADGTTLRNLSDLRRAFQNMSSETYQKHVTADRNDFANWIEHALARPGMARAVRQATTWPELDAALNLRE